MGDLAISCKNALEIFAIKDYMHRLDIQPQYDCMSLLSTFRCQSLCSEVDQNVG